MVMTSDYASRYEPSQCERATNANQPLHRQSVMIERN